MGLVTQDLGGRATQDLQEMSMQSEIMWQMVQSPWHSLESLQVISNDLAFAS